MCPGERMVCIEREAPRRRTCAGAEERSGRRASAVEVSNSGRRSCVSKEIRAGKETCVSKSACAGKKTIAGQEASFGRKARAGHQASSGASGSVTLEAAIALPAFLLFAMLIILLVKTAIASMALQSALTQTVRLAASAWYPIHLAQTAAATDKEEHAGQENAGPGDAGKLEDVLETIGEYGDYLPSPLKEWAEAMADGKRALQEEAAKRIFGSLALSLSDSGVLDTDRFRIAHVELPRPDNGQQLTLEGEYRLPFRVPFANRPLVIRAAAAERVWVGGQPSRAVRAEPGGEGLDVQFVSLTPDPVRPGRKATLVLRTRPGAALDLSVFYKSGESKAKNLGRAVADEAGYISWTWHVSGNTTSGQWSWVVSGEGGIHEQTFRVERAGGQEGR